MFRTFKTDRLYPEMWCCFEVHSRGAPRAAPAPHAPACPASRRGLEFELVTVPQLLAGRRSAPRATWDPTGRRRAGRMWLVESFADPHSRAPPAPAAESPMS